MVKKACQEGIEIIENCGENRLKNSIFDNVLLKTMLCSNLQPLWTVLARFWNIWGRFWVHLWVTKVVQNQTCHNSTSQLLGPHEASGRPSATIFGRFGTIFA